MFKFKILREQLSPFDIELRAVERQLDFTDAGKAVSRFLANRNRRLFSMSTDNALVTLLREGVSVQESAVDSKRDLEDSLRSACNDFIEHTSHSMARDIFNLDQWCKASGGAMAEQAFMNGETIKNMLEQALQQLEKQLSDILEQMNLYLDSSVTQSILLKPVSRKIIRGIEEARKNIDKVSDDSNGWNPAIRKEVVSILNNMEAVLKVAIKSMK
jgi:conserved oligomeric Golgi complex subunit 3